MWMKGRGVLQETLSCTLLHLASCDGSAPAAAAALQLWQAHLPVRLRSS